MNNSNTKEDYLIPTILDVLKDDNEEIMEDYYSLGKEIYDEFDEYAHKKGHGYLTLDFPIFNQKLEGLEEGLYIFAGESNSGKTAVMTNMMWSYCNNDNNKLFGIYYSLDDNTNEVIPRLISMNQCIPISVCSKPNRSIDFINENEDIKESPISDEIKMHKEYLKKRTDGLQQLRDANKKFLILDRQRISSFEQLQEHAKKVQQYVKSYDPDNNIIIAIDSLADLNFSTKKYATDRERIDNIAMAVKHMSNTELRVPVFTSYHLRKLNRDGRPTLDDMKDSSRIVYEASAVFLVFNDVSKNKQAANIYYTNPDDSEKHPIIEIDWAKNKKSSYKGRTYNYFVPNYSKIRECGKQESDRFDSLVYTK